MYSYEGESDAAYPTFASHYKGNLRKFIHALRIDLPMATTAPIVLAKEDISAYVEYLGNLGDLSSTQVSELLAQNSLVRADDDWAAANLKDVREVDTVALAHFDPPLVHLTNVAQLTLGEQMAAISEPLLP